MRPRRWIALVLLFCVTASSIEVLFGREASPGGLETLVAVGEAASPSLVPEEPAGEANDCPCLCACGCSSTRGVVLPRELLCMAAWIRRPALYSRPPLAEQNRPSPRPRPPLV